MNAGRLRYRVIFEERVAQGDGFTWQTAFTVWADKRPMSAREFMASDQVVSKSQGFFVIRWRDDADPTMRMRIGTAVYNIEGLLEDNKTGRSWLNIPYSHGTNAG